MMAVTANGELNDNRHHQPFVSKYKVTFEVTDSLSPHTLLPICYSS